MQSIKRIYGDNIGGSTRLLFIPHQHINKALFPVRGAGSMYIEDDIILLDDKAWFYIDCVRESIDAPSENNRDDNGSMYTHKAAGFISGDDMNTAAVLDSMTHQRFVVLRKDSNGHWCLLGNIREPLKFTYRKQPRNRVTGLKGFDIEFYGTCSLPELYYFGNITYAQPDDEPPVLIPGTQIPIPQAKSGWTPILAVVNDGARRVLQVIDWVGGVSSKPAVNVFIGEEGFVENIDDAVDIRGNDGDDGLDGWTPILAVVNDGERRVLQVVDWTGSTGSKPTTGLYVGASGLVANIANGVDIRGSQGQAGTGLRTYIHYRGGGQQSFASLLNVWLANISNTSVVHTFNLVSNGSMLGTGATPNLTRLRADTIGIMLPFQCCFKQARFSVKHQVNEGTRTYEVFFYANEEPQDSARGAALNAQKLFQDTFTTVNDQQQDVVFTPSSFPTLPAHTKIYFSMRCTNNPDSTAMRHPELIMIFEEVI